MQNKKNLVYTAVSSLIILLVYNLLVFILSDERSNVFWLAYAFTMVSLLCSCTIPIALPSGAQTRKDAFLHIPIYLHCIIYTTIQMLVGVVLMLASINFKIAFLIEVIVFAVFLLNVISSLFAKNVIEARGEEIKQSTAFIRMLTIDVETLRKNTADEALSKKIKELEDVVRYSDPVNNPAIEDVEQRIKMAVSSLISKVDNLDAATLEADNLIKLFDERNRKCRALK